MNTRHGFRQSSCDRPQDKRNGCGAAGAGGGLQLPERYVADVWETKTLYEGISLTDFTVKGHYAEDAWFIPVLKEMSITLPIVAMEDESAIFCKANAVLKVGNIHWIDKGEIRDGYLPNYVDMLIRR